MTAHRYWITCPPCAAGHGYDPSTLDKGQVARCPACRLVWNSNGDASLPLSRHLAITSAVLVIFGSVAAMAVILLQSASPWVVALWVLALSVTAGDVVADVIAVKARLRASRVTADGEPR